VWGGDEVNEIGGGVPGCGRGAGCSRTGRDYAPGKDAARRDGCSSQAMGVAATHLAPMTFVTNFFMAAVRRSGRSARKSSRRSNSGMRFQSPGSGSSSASLGQGRGTWCLMTKEVDCSQIKGGLV
jgi:hypothetical protein